MSERTEESSPPRRFRPERSRFSSALFACASLPGKKQEFWGKARVRLWACGRNGRALTSRSSGRASVASLSESAIMSSMPGQPRHSARISAAIRGLRAAAFSGSRASLNSSVTETAHMTP